MNINPKSYRLGNLIREVNSGQIVEVIGIKKEIKSKPSNVANVEYFTLEVSGNFPDGWQVEEIPLTVDIFEILGFNEGMHPGTYYLDTFGYWPLITGIGWFGGGTNRNVYSVSDMQNDYFNYFKEELNVSRLNVAKIPLRP